MDGVGGLDGVGEEVEEEDKKEDENEIIDGLEELVVMGVEE